MIVFAEEALTDLERILAFHAEPDPSRGPAELEKIRSAVLVLEAHPWIGRPVTPTLRELVISLGKAGYVALYHFDELDHLVRVLAVRHQLEAGYRGR